MSRRGNRIYELLAEAGSLDAIVTESREMFAQGLDGYRRQDWEQAVARLEACHRLVPDDRPSEVYLERITRLRADPPPADWNGTWRLAAK